jgi:hypothetical protein
LREVLLTTQPSWRRKLPAASHTIRIKIQCAVGYVSCTDESLTAIFNLPSFSCGYRDLLRCALRYLSELLYMQIRGLDDMPNLLRIEWLRKHIEAPKIEHFGPERFVRQLRTHDHHWFRSIPIQMIQHITPSAVWKIALADHYGYLAPFQPPDSGMTGACSYNPAGAVTKDLA